MKPFLVVSLIAFFHLLPAQLFAAPVEKTIGVPTTKAEGLLELQDEASAPQTQSFYLLNVIQRTLLSQPAILIQREKIAEDRGGIKARKGPYDWRLSAYGALDRDKNSSLTYPFPGYHEVVTPLLGFGVKKTFSFGPTIEGGMTLKRTSYRQSYLDQLNTSSQGTWLSYRTENVGRLDFKLTIPILPLMGDANHGADLIVQRLQYRASLYNLQAKTAETVYRTAVAYWEYAGSYQQLDILRKSYERAKLLLKNTEDLAYAGEVPTIEIENARGNVADRINAYYNARQSLVVAKARLAETIGISLAELETYATPADAFPKLDMNSIADVLAAAERYCRMALEHRTEINSLGELLSAAGALVTSARNHLLPDVNLQFGVGYDGSRRGAGTDDFFNTLRKNQPGVDYSARLVLEYPLGNQAASGTLDQRLAQLRQMKLQKLQLSTLIKSNVLVSLHGLRNAMKELEQIEGAVIIYENTFIGEREKFRAGETTLMNIIDIQNRLDNVLINRIVIRKKVANAIVQVRFETGTLVRFSDGEGTVSMNELVTIPRAR